MDQDPTETLNEHPTRLDYYEDMQILKDPDEDDTPVLPEHAVNVNEDYAGIYDYRGSPDGRYRRKRTLTTNIEQLLIRSSRLNRVRRSISDNSLSETISAGERAERLVSLLRILQDADPAFDANDFLKVLHTPSVSDQDLEYLIYLSNIADLTGATALFPRPADRDHDVRERNFDASEKQSVQGNLETARSLQSTWPELIELARMQQQRRKGQQKQHFLQQSSEPFFLVPDFILLDDSSIASKREQPPKSSLTFSRLFAIAALMAQQQYDPTGIAM
ncbi:uncharacterized protein LOC111247966 [Varroa destructor]|uniref:Uncharacterized protein n=2 Tax=Varroa TaxID=62624 RepID=A0A7M7JZW7_VARDE|nr:uncharacterized protein LOC111247966 [Varroa destructor]